MERRHSLLTLLALSCTLAASPSFAAQPASVQGEKWLVTQSSGTPGDMTSIPPTEMCVPKGSNTSEAPPQRQGCSVTNLRRTGNKQMAHMQCDSKGQVMEGDMEIESLGPDHYRQTFHMKMTGMGTIDMVMEGKKIGGACDTNAPAAAIAASAKASDPAPRASAHASTPPLTGSSSQGMKELCKIMVESQNVEMLSSPDAPCKDPSYKAAFCSQAQSYEGFRTLLLQKRNAASDTSGQDTGKRMEQTTQFCGFAEVPTHERLCNGAEAAGKWEFLASECPSLADRLAAENCVGRDSTGQQVPMKYVEFCRAWSLTPAGEKSAADEAKKRAEATKPDAKSKAKDLLKNTLKGIFSH